MTPDEANAAMQREYEARVDRVRDAKARLKKDLEDPSKDTEFYCVVVCRDRADRKAFVRELGVHENERYVSVDRVRAWKGAAT